MAEILFNDTEKESFNKKLVTDLSRIVFGRGYIIKAGELVGYEIKGSKNKGKCIMSMEKGADKEVFTEINSPSS